MSRPLRMEYPDAWYHVLNRGRRREQIFRDDRDREIFLQTVREACESWRLRVAAYGLMPNHYHLLVQTPGGNLSRCFRHIDGVYTQRFNRLARRLRGDRLKEIGEVFGIGGYSTVSSAAQRVKVGMEQDE